MKEKKMRTYGWAACGRYGPDGFRAVSARQCAGRSLDLGSARADAKCK